LLLAAALLSKSVTCSLPAALLLVLWWKGRTPSRKEIVALAVMFTIALAMAATTASLERTHVQAVGREWNFSPLDRLLIAGRAVWFYLTKIVLPLNLSFVYPRWPIDAGQLWQWAFPLGVVAALAALWLMRDRWGRGPLVAALIFVGTLVPALGFFNIYPMRYTLVADHYAYLATPALFVLIAIALDRCLRRGAAAYIVLVPLVVLTLARAGVLADSESLWRDTLAKNPDSWMVHLNLAKTLDGKDDPEAGGHFAQAVTLAPELVDTRMDYGTFLANQKRFDEAIAQYNRAIEINPHVPQVYLHLGRTYRKMGRADDARRAFEEALKLDPSLAASP